MCSVPIGNIFTVEHHDDNHNRGQVEGEVVDWIYHKLRRFANILSQSETIVKTSVIFSPRFGSLFSRLSERLVSSQLDARM